MTLHDIEALTKRFADARSILSEKVQELEALLTDVKRKKLRGIKVALGNAVEAEAALRAAIEGAPALFANPKTIVLHGVKVGWRKAPGKLIWDDADQVICLIKKHLPDQLDVLVVTKQTPSKPALAQLETRMLKHLGVRVVETGEEVVIAPTDGEVASWSNALLKDARDDAAEAT